MMIIMRIKSIIEVFCRMNILRFYSYYYVYYYEYDYDYKYYFYIYEYDYVIIYYLLY